MWEDRLSTWGRRTGHPQKKGKSKALMPDRTDTGSAGRGCGLGKGARSLQTTTVLPLLPLSGSDTQEEVGTFVSLKATPGDAQLLRQRNSPCRSESTPSA